MMTPKYFVGPPDIIKDCIDDIRKAAYATIADRYHDRDLKMDESDEQFLAGVEEACHKLRTEVDIHIGERKMIFAEVITDWDWKDGSMDHYMTYLAHTLVGRYRSMTRVEKSAEAPFTRTCHFEVLKEASEPITYAIEYRIYDREYITDDILKELKMGLERVDENDVRMTVKEFERWNQSACNGCKAFNGFYTEEGYPVYYNCKAHNTTGYDFVSEMPKHGCRFKAYYKE